MVPSFEQPRNRRTRAHTTDDGRSGSEADIRRIHRFTVSLSVQTYATVYTEATPGQFKSEKDDEFHLPRDKARALMSLVVDAYRKSHGGEAPKEPFIHGKTRFSYEEWEG